MARDLLLGRTKWNWARGGHACSSPVSDEVTFKLTPPEMAMLADLASTKMLADLGDRTASKKMADVKRRLKLLQRKARQGDPKAKRSLLVLEESGVFRRTQSFTLGSFIGGEALVPNTAYRVAVLRQARKIAGGNTPSTKHFFHAKQAVDGAMASAGLSLYLPGARPGRITQGY